MKTLVLGAAIVDKVMKLEKLPASGDDILASGETTEVGGCAYNVSNTLDLFETEHDLVVPVGKGMYADAIEKQLIEDGHEIFIRDNEGDNGYCLCLVEPDGERTFITIPGIEMDFKRRWFDKIDMTSYDSVYISGYELYGSSGDVIIEFLEKNPGPAIYLAPGPRITELEREKLERVYRLNPIIHLNDKEIKEYTGLENLDTALDYIHQKTGNAVYVTLGKEGVICLGEDKKYYRAAGYETQVVDTIGAGDSHIGAIIALKKLGYSYTDICDIANKVASKLVSVKGAKLDINKFEKREFLR